jgi:predicted membrane protein
MKNLNNNPTNRIWSGLIILFIGLVFLLRNFGVEIPHWVLSWHMLLIAIGIFIGFKRNFQGGGWLVMVLIGAFFTIQDMGDFDFSKYFFALIFIALGLYLIIKPKGESSGCFKKRKDFDVLTEQQVPPVDFKEDKKDAADILDAVSIFGGADQKVFSKNFKGGDVLAIFGGCDLNLSQTDFKDTITIEVVAIFGGVKIIVPPSWEVKSEVVTIFGGLEDKRAVAPFSDVTTKKVLVIKGVALFGGISIKNY